MRISSNAIGVYIVMDDFDESFKKTRKGNSDLLKFTYRRNELHALFWLRARVFQVVYSFKSYAFDVTGIV